MVRFFSVIFALCIFSVFVLSGCSSSGCDKFFAGDSQVREPQLPTDSIRQIVTVDVKYLDGVPIADVAIESDNPLVRIVNARTDANGHYVFDINAPDGTVFTLSFGKQGHIISSSSASVTVGHGGLHEGNTITYPVLAYGYIPLDADGVEGRTSDFFAENIGIYNAPMDMVLSPDGKKMYVADSFNHRIRVVDMDTGFISTLAGCAISGYMEGTGGAARFWEPMGLAITKDGKTLYVADQMNECVRKINTVTAQVSLVAGIPGSAGNVNNSNFLSKFSNPGMIALSTDESTLYVADSQNKIIKKIDLVGNNGVASLGSAFAYSIYGVCLANDGTRDILYIAATFEHKVYSMDTTTGARTFIAGSSTNMSNGDWVDGIGTVAKFNIPVGIAVSQNRNYLYVSDNATSTIRKIDLSNNNTVSTLSASTSGYSEGASPEFLSPAGLNLFSNDARLLIADTSNNRIRVMDVVSGAAQKLSGGGRAGFVDGPAGDSTLAFNGNVYSVALTADSKTMYVSDIKSIWKVDVATRDAVEIAGSCYLGTAYMYNIAYNFDKRPTSHKIVLSHDEKTIYIADSTSNMIRSIDIASGNSTVVAGNTTASFADALTGADARFNEPDGLALSPAGDVLYVSDGWNHRIRKVVIATGATTTVAGSVAGWLDAAGTSAKFNLPTDVAISPAGDRLYVADSYNHRVRMIDLANGNNVTTVAGNASVGRQDGVGTAAVFDEPRGLAITSDGSLLFVTDCRGANIRRINLATLAVTTYAGGVATGFADGTGEEVLFYNPDGIAVSRDSSQLFIADNWNSMIRRVVASYFGTY